MRRAASIQLTGATTIDSDGGLLTGEDLGAEVEVAIGEPRFGWYYDLLAYPADTNPWPMAWDELENPVAVHRRQSAPAVLRARRA